MPVHNKNKTQGFTLFEMIIVMLVLTIILPTVFSILYVITEQQFRVYALTKTKREGDYMYSYIRERIIRDASSIVDDRGTLNPICNAAGSTYSSTAGDDFIFVDKSGATFNWSYSGTALFVDDGINQSQIHSDAITVDDFLIRCRKNTSSSPTIVEFSFDVSFSSQTEETILLPYKTKVVLRP